LSLGLTGSLKIDPDNIGIDSFSFYLFLKIKLVFFGMFPAENDVIPLAQAFRVRILG